MDTKKKIQEKEGKRKYQINKIIKPNGKINEESKSEGKKKKEK